MSRILILTRHAKSCWDHPAIDDHARPLNRRGQRSARAIGEWLRNRGVLPDEVVSSSALRTRETWEHMRLDAPAVTYFDEFYHAPAVQMLRVLAGAQGETVLMLGHNPGIADFAERLVNTAPAHPRFFDYPTCATTVIRFNIADWADVSWHSGAVLEFVIPRELTG